jgi:integrase
LSFSRAAVIYAEDGGETTYLAPLVRHFRDREVAHILPAEIQLAARKLYPGRKPATWNRQVIVPARAVINHCAALGLCHPIRVGRFAESKPLRKAVTFDWLERLRAHAPAHLAALMTFMMMTGARLGQALAMTPDLLDLADASARIPAAKRHAERIAFLPPQLVADLANLTPRRGRVFGFLRKEPVYKALRRACAAAGIEYLATHQPGRHSFATEMIVRQGVDVATAAKLGGWKSHRLLTETYAHAENERAVATRVFASLAPQPLAKAPPRPRKRVLKPRG